MYVCLVTEVIKQSTETTAFQSMCLQDEGDQNVYSETLIFFTSCCVQTTL